jgi:hypothetical protein
MVVVTGVKSLVCHSRGEQEFGRKMMKQESVPKRGELERK